MPLFSKIPVPPLPNIPISSGLMCAHPNCFALFSNLDDSETHAFEAHAGKVIAVTCAISEHQLESGDMELRRVLTEIDESENGSREKTQPTPISHFGTNGGNSSGIRNLDAHGPPDCGAEQLEARFVPALALLPSTPSQPPVLSQAATPSSVSYSASQSQALSHNSTQPISRQSTLSATSSLSSFSSEGGEGLKLNRILSMVQDITGEPCRICWVDKNLTRPHQSFRCITGVCSGTEWKSFKKDLRFPPGKVCYFCMAPYGPPFNHARPLAGEPRSPDQCDYPDVLKELAYILYARPSLREKVFARLGDATPTTLEAYKRYIAKRQNGGIFGAYNAIHAYLEVREEEALAVGI